MSGQIKPSKATVNCIKGQPCRVHVQHNVGAYVIRKDDCVWGRENNCEFFTDDGCAYLNKDIKRKKKPDDDVTFF